MVVTCSGGSNCFRWGRCPGWPPRDDLKTPHRYNAACAASLAAAGNGKNAEKLQDQDKAKLRRLALDWLRADLALWRQQRKSGNAQDLQRLIETLAHWQRDSDLIFGRDARELAKLPEDEREPWRELWADVARLLMEAKAAPATGDGSEYGQRKADLQAYNHDAAAGC